jgi:hypothetical protein
MVRRCPAGSWLRRVRPRLRCALASTLFIAAVARFEAARYAGPAAWAPPIKRGVTRLQPHISRQSAQSDRDDCSRRASRQPSPGCGRSLAGRWQSQSGRFGAPGPKHRRSADRSLCGDHRERHDSVSAYRPHRYHSNGRPAAHDRAQSGRRHTRPSAASRAALKRSHRRCSNP